MSFIPVDLSIYYNNNGIKYSTEKSCNFTGFGSSFPGDQLPQGNININDIPFIFPSSQSQFNNIEFNKQKVSVPKNSHSGLHILGASDNGSFFESLHLYNDNFFEDSIILSLTEWVSISPKYNELEAFRCNYLCSLQGQVHTVKPVIWHQIIHLKRPTIFNSIMFPDNPCMHVFSLTLESGECIS